ncbi:RdgB/HAM1 family non-canonical purine NTP pyrophosphatase [Demequina sp. NBRC 110053]|uniref:RdgB/HAM1 family non-canonical purine NTP pyrophosphatase n=1 Tax=Demequina sp. NBRC 110053 TaxID=1570342 RepID=UPI0009FE7B49|nr:RdgB/HAM1 family non-canonical purine NTP pyrophosphatase [Demequina sp. NBRC 110053]
MARLAIATRNSHKVDEIWAILEPLLPHLHREDVASALDLDAPSPVEDGVTFEANALIKARALAASTGVPALADDSGIAVDVLGGSPGIFSARWAGSHGDDAANLRLLLDQLADVPDEHRGAAFVCAAALVTPDGREYVEVGRMPGELAREPRGDGGFGYDPIFVAEGQSVTNAELDADAKNAISHRGAAFRAMAPHVVAVLG